MTMPNDLIQIPKAQYDFDTVPMLLDFNDLQPIQVKVKVRQRDYILTEASGDAAVKYRNAAMRAAKLSDGKVVGIEGAADADPLLVSQCLFIVDKEGNLPLNGDGSVDKRALVALTTLLSWPFQIQKTLYETVKKISPGLTDDLETPTSLRKQISSLQEKLAKLEGEEAALPKNVPVSTQATSS